MHYSCSLKQHYLRFLIEVGTDEFLKLLSLHWRDLNCLLTHSMGNKGWAFSVHG